VACPTMSSSNITVLTQSHAAAAKKRKAKRDEVKEIVFDDEARRCVIRVYFLSCLWGAEAQADIHILREFLTGFRKRKQKRIEEKQAKRKEREKKERLEARKQASFFLSMVRGARN
jgi:ribosomal RNA-processing protein 17